jgi:hypothetical protein
MNETQERSALYACAETRPDGRSCLTILTKIDSGAMFCPKCGHLYPPDAYQDSTVSED